MFEKDLLYNRKSLNDLLLPIQMWILGSRIFMMAILIGFIYFKKAKQFTFLLHDTLEKRQN